jgi:hypothetical protein
MCRAARVAVLVGLLLGYCRMAIELQQHRFGLKCHKMDLSTAMQERPSRKRSRNLDKEFHETDLFAGRN